MWVVKAICDFTDDNENDFEDEEAIPCSDRLNFNYN